MHICIFLQNTHPNKYFNLKVGGVANQILQLLPPYEKIKNLKISIVTKYSEYQATTNKLEIYRILKFRNVNLNSIYFQIKSFFKMIRIHKKNPINILNIHQYYNIIISPLLIHLIFKIPILMKIPIDFETYIRDVSYQEKQRLKARLIHYCWLKLFKNFIVKRIDFIRVINEKIYRDLLEFKFPEERILKIPNGISIKSFTGIQKIKSSNTHFGYVGRIVRFKNIIFLLEVFKIYLIKNPHDKLFLYGEGSYDKFISRFIEKNRLTNNIILCGFEKDKRKIYSNIDVLIDPALAQGISNAILEAMCTKTLVIASNVYGNRDIIKDRITGLLFNPYKKENLLNQLIYFKENNDIIIKIIKTAKKKIILNYDIDEVANKIYKFLISSKKSVKGKEKMPINN